MTIADPKVSVVLGSAGFVGKCLCEYLTKQGLIVRRYDIKDNPTEDLRIDKPSFSWADNVYLLAWDTGGSKYLNNENTQQAQLCWNTKILTNIMPQLAQSGKPFLFVSSRLAGTWNAYGVTKLLGEYWTKVVGGSTVRLWNPYGGIEHDVSRSYVVNDFIRQALTLKEIHMLTDGTEHRHFVFEEDVSRGLKMAMDMQPDVIYDIAGHNRTQIGEIAVRVAKRTGAAIYLGSKRGIEESDFVKPDLLPGFEPQISLDEGIDRTIEKYKEHLDHVKG